ncbi:MAG: sulfotransferase, partial [Candidatus Thermoplasmatota archaeon]|nr:sulfotransferase [Candidatus Thermoplasmatota archaeon]
WPGTASYTVAPEVAFAPPLAPNELRELLGNYLTTLFEELLRSTNHRVLFLDETWALLFMRELHELLPRARFIHMLRDPRDVIASFSQQRWCPRDLVEATRFYLELIDRTLAQRQELGARYYEARLETLVADPRKTITNICEFLGLAFTEELLDVDLSRPHTGRWRSEFNTHEQQTINALVKEKLLQLGYLSENESVEN